MASSDPVARPRSHRQADKKTSEKQTAIVLNLHCKLPAFSSKHQRYLWHQSVSSQHGLCCVFYRSEDQSSISWTFLVIVCVELQRKHQGKDYNLYYLIWAYQNIFLKLFYDIREIGHQLNYMVMTYKQQFHFLLFVNRYIFCCVIDRGAMVCTCKGDGHRFLVLATCVVDFLYLPFGHRGVFYFLGACSSSTCMQSINIIRFNWSMQTLGKAFLKLHVHTMISDVSICVFNTAQVFQTKTSNGGSQALKQCRYTVNTLQFPSR